jgi:threonine aldolase
MQLASKMRYISAQYLAYFRNDLWKKCASHSNAMAALLAEKISGTDGVTITQPVQSNGVFLIMPKTVAEKLMDKYFFYSWNEEISEYRLMTSWDTTEDDIEDFVKLMKRESGVK